METETIFESLPEPPSDDEIIDRILKALNQADFGNHYLFENYYSKFGTVRIERIVRLISYHDLAEVKGTVYGTFNYPLAITGKGTFIDNQGGWIAYLEKQRQEEVKRKKREDEAHQAVIDSTRASKISATSAIVSLMVAFFATYITWLGYDNGKKKDAETESLKNRLIVLEKAQKLSYSLMRGQIIAPKKAKHRMDSLPIRKR